MASTNKTTNYELSQFIETDRPAWLTDYNGDMRTIDSTMKAISDVASGASGSISELADRMSTAEGNITTNANNIDALEARADALEAQAQSTAGTIANIQTEQTAQNLGIEAATELGYNLARPYDSASTYAVGDYVLFQNTLYKCITAVPVGEAFDPTKWLAIKATDEIADGGYTLPIASASQLGGVKVGNNLSIDPITGILSADSVDYEVIPLDGTNFDLTVNTANVKIYENYYTSHPTAPTTTTTLTSPTAALTSVEDCKLVKIGKYRHLQLSVNFSFAPSINESAANSYVYYFSTNKPSIIDAPVLGHATCFCGGNNSSLNAMPNEFFAIKIYADRIDYIMVTTLASTWPHNSALFRNIELSWIAR